MNNAQLTYSQKHDWLALVARVNMWTVQNRPDEYMYNSKQTYWGSALQAGIITQDEYNLGRNMYAQLWNYVGD